MNFNLKNRPDTGDALAKAVFDEWFEGFEKELREKLAGLGDTTIHSMHDNVKGKIAAQNQKEIIEEVLGVEPKVKEETKR